MSNTKTVRDKMEYREYAKDLNIEDRKWIEQFYQEYYNDLVDGLPEDLRILKSAELVTEARRRHNCMKRDAFEVAKKMNNLDYTGDDNDFMEAASDEWEWRDGYTVGGYELACQCIFLQAIKQLKEIEDVNEKMVILAGMYVKMNELRLLNNRQTKRNR